MVLVLTAIRKLVQPLVREMVRQGLSGVKILDILRGQGLGYRMTDFYSDLRRFTSSLAKKQPILATPLRYRFERKLFEPSTQIVNKFEYIVNVFTRHKVTGEIRKREAIIDLSREATRNFIEQEAVWYMSELSPRANEEVVSAEIDSLYYNPTKIW